MNAPSKSLTALTPAFANLMPVNSKIKSLLSCLIYYSLKSVTFRKNQLYCSILRNSIVRKRERVEIYGTFTIRRIKSLVSIALEVGQLFPARSCATPFKEKRIACTNKAPLTVLNGRISTRPLINLWVYGASYSGLSVQICDFIVTQSLYFAHSDRSERSRIIQEVKYFLFLLSHVSRPSSIHSPRDFSDQLNTAETVFASDLFRL